MKAQIGPFTYTVYLSRTYLGDEVEPHATSSHLSRTIRIHPDVPECDRPVVLLHEIIHAVAITYGLDLTEEQVTILEAGIGQGLRSLGWIPATLSPVSQVIFDNSVTHTTNTNHEVGVY